MDSSGNFNLGDRLAKFFSIESAAQVYKPQGPPINHLTQWLGRIDKTAALESRLKFMPQFCAFIQGTSMDNRDLWRCWSAVSDLLTMKEEFQKAAYFVLFTICQSHYSNLENLRGEFFSVIQQNPNIDSSLRIKALSLLTDQGRKIVPFEKEVCDFLLDWLQKFPTKVELYKLLTDIVKYNFMLIEEPVQINLIRLTCAMSNEANVGTIQQSLNLFDAIVRYGQIPPECLQDFICSLCRTVNIETFCDNSWVVMANILTGHSGYQCLVCLRSILDNTGNYSQVGLLRGAVFFLSMAIWGARRIVELTITPVFVLHSLLSVLNSDHFIVALEVALALKRLITKHSIGLSVEWNTIFKILEKLRLFLSNKSISQITLSVLDAIETLVQNKSFLGDDSSWVKTLQIYSHHREPKHSFFILEIIKERLLITLPISEQWYTYLKNMMSHFFITEQRTAIREKTLETLQQVIEDHHYYANSIAEHIILTFLPTVYFDDSETVRVKGIYLIIQITPKLDGQIFDQMIDVLVAATKAPNVHVEIRKSAVSGLIQILDQVFQSPKHHRTLYTLQHLIPLLNDSDPDIRRLVSAWLLTLRSNNFNSIQLGDQICFSLCARPNPQPPFGTFPVDQIIQAIIERVKNEEQHDIWKELVVGLQEILWNRWLISHLKILPSLCSTLCTQAISKDHFKKLNTQLNESQSTKQYQMIYSLIIDVLPNATQYDEIIEAFKEGVFRNAANPTPSKLQLILLCLNGIQLLTLYEPKTTQVYSPIISVLHDMISPKNVSQCAFILYFLAFIQPYSAKLPETTISVTFSLILKFIDAKQAKSQAVITFANRVMSLWFLLVPLPRRKFHFEHIKQNLSNQITQNGSLLAEAQMDLLSRYTFTNLHAISDELPEDSTLFNAKTPADTWLQGNTLLSITHGKLGWIRIKLRRATGCVVWLMQLQNHPFEWDLEKDPDEMTEQMKSPSARKGSVREENSLKSSRDSPRSGTPVQQLVEGTESPRLRDPPSRPHTPQPEPHGRTELLESGNQSAQRRSGSASLESTEPQSKRHGSKPTLPLRSSRSSDPKDPEVSSQLFLKEHPPTTEPKQTSKVVILAEAEKPEPTEKKGPELTEKKTPEPTEKKIPELPTKQSHSSRPDSPKTLEVTIPQRKSPDDLFKPSTSRRSPTTLAYSPQKEKAYNPIFSSSSPSSLISSFDPYLQTEEDEELFSPKSSLPVSPPQEEGDIVIPLSHFYPPLPAYDDDLFGLEMESGPGKLSTEAQLYLHAINIDSSSESSAPSSWTSPSQSSSFLWYDGTQATGLTLQMTGRNEPAIAVPKRVLSRHKNIIIDLAPETKENRPSPAHEDNDPLSSLTATVPTLVDTELEQIQDKPEVRPRKPSTVPMERKISGSPPRLLPRRPTPQSSAPAHANPKQDVSRPDHDNGTEAEEPSPLLPIKEKPKRVSVPKPLDHDANRPPPIPPFPPMPRPEATTSVAILKPRQGSLTLRRRTEEEESPDDNQLHKATKHQIEHESLLFPPHQMFDEDKIAEEATRYVFLSVPPTSRALIDDSESLSSPESPTFRSKSHPTEQLLHRGIIRGRHAQRGTSPKERRPQSQTDMRVSYDSSWLPSPRGFGGHFSIVTYSISGEKSRFQGSPPIQLPSSSPEKLTSPIPQALGKTKSPPSKLSPASPRVAAPDPPTIPLKHQAHPSLIFLQLQNLGLNSTPVVYLEPSEKLDRAINLLDQTLSVETHKIGVLYIGMGQVKEQEILSNTHGSPQYTQFLRALGSIVQLNECGSNIYTGGLDRSSELRDGQFSVFWKDEVTQVMFHVATLMPTTPQDPNCTLKKSHIGNDYVHIVYNDSGRPTYDIQTLSGQFNFVVIVITPREPGYFCVSVTRKPGVPTFGPISATIIVPEVHLAQLIRETAIFGNIASQMLDEKNKTLQYVSNCEERLRQFKQIAERFTTPAKSAPASRPGYFSSH